MYKNIDCCKCDIGVKIWIVHFRWYSGVGYSGKKVLTSFKNNGRVQYISKPIKLVIKIWTFSLRFRISPGQDFNKNLIYQYE